MIFTISKSFSSKVERTPRVLQVAEAFGLGVEDQDWVIYDNLEVEVNQGDVVYVTGQSGSGKSVILRELARQLGENGYSVANIDHVALEDAALIDQIGTSVNDGLSLLNIAGLNDAYLFVRKPYELSDGQRYRFRIAKLVASDAQVWIADEFGAVLDRTTAQCVASSLQRAARKAGATLIVATTHTDLVNALKPSLKITKRYKEAVLVETQKEIDHE